MSARALLLRSVVVACAAVFASLALAFGGAASAASTFTGPIPYLSVSDVPAGFYASGSPGCLEDFEDGATVDCGMTVDGGVWTRSSGAFNGSNMDSVGGGGAVGNSWFVSSGSAGLTFTLPSPQTAAGIVWTDGQFMVDTTFEAFGPGMVSLGTIGPVPLGDGDFNGGTAEDRFFGVQDPDGIIAIRLSTTTPAIGMEVDHVQYGSSVAAVPAMSPTGISILVGLTAALGIWALRPR